MPRLYDSTSFISISRLFATINSLAKKLRFIFTAISLSLLFFSIVYLPDENVGNRVFFKGVKISGFSTNKFVWANSVSCTSPICSALRRKFAASFSSTAPLDKLRSSCWSTSNGSIICETVDITSCTAFSWGWHFDLSRSFCFLQRKNKPLRTNNREVFWLRHLVNVRLTNRHLEAKCTNLGMDCIPAMYLHLLTILCSFRPGHEPSMNRCRLLFLNPNLLFVRLSDRKRLQKIHVRFGVEPQNLMIGWYVFLIEEKIKDKNQQKTKIIV